MKKKVLATMLGKNDTAKALIAKLATYGLEPAVHLWQSDNQKMAWMGVRDAVQESSTAAWIIIDTASQLADGDTRYGLSMVALSLLNRKRGIPILIIETGKDQITGPSLPTALQHARILPIEEVTPAKLVAKVHSPASAPKAEWLLEMVGDDKLGQWFAVRPAKGSWDGMIFGVCGAEINFQAVGPAGNLPDKAVLNYPMQGLKVEMQNKEFTAWALRNRIDSDQAYYVKVTGFPETVLFGPYAEDQAAELFAVHLK